MAKSAILKIHIFYGAIPIESRKFQIKVAYNVNLDGNFKNNEFERMKNSHEYSLTIDGSCNKGRRDTSLHKLVKKYPELQAFSHSVTWPIYVFRSTYKTVFLTGLIAFSLFRNPH